MVIVSIFSIALPHWNSAEAGDTVRCPVEAKS